jgi:hypothetical protein
MATKLKIEKGGMKLKKIFSSETTEPISTKLCWNDPWVVPFQKCVRQRRPVSKMAAITKNEISSNGQNCSILRQKASKFELYKHNDELFNIYYGIFLWTLNFCRFWPIMQFRKKGGWNLKKSLLLWNYWANLNQTLLKWSCGGPLSKLCPSAPSCIQDGRHY